MWESWIVISMKFGGGILIVLQRALPIISLFSFLHCVYMYNTYRPMFIICRTASLDSATASRGCKEARRGEGWYAIYLPLMSYSSNANLVLWFLVALFCGPIKPLYVLPFETEPSAFLWSLFQWHSVVSSRCTILLFCLPFFKIIKESYSRTLKPLFLPRSLVPLYSLTKYFPLLFPH